jgi:hypothetical protein
MNGATCRGEESDHFSVATGEQARTISGLYVRLLDRLAGKKGTGVSLYNAERQRAQAIVRQ